MATQIVEIDRHDASATIQLRDDVLGVLVLVTDRGRPVDLLRILRPASGMLDPRDILGRAAGGEHVSADVTEAAAPAVPKPSPTGSGVNTWSSAGLASIARATRESGPPAMKSWHSWTMMSS